MLSCSVSTMKIVANYLKLAIHSNCGQGKEMIVSRYEEERSKKKKKKVAHSPFFHLLHSLAESSGRGFSPLQGET